MQSCNDPLKRAFGELFPEESDKTLSSLSRILSLVMDEKDVFFRDIRSLPDVTDVLLLMDEWRLVRPVGGSPTKAWEDTSQLLITGKDFVLVFPAWITPLVSLACASGELQVRKAILIFFSDQDHPAWLKMPSFLSKMAKISLNGIIDATQINQLLRNHPLGLSPDTLIAQLKSYGFISPHLRADFFRMRSPQYEIHPLIAATPGLEGELSEAAAS